MLGLLTFYYIEMKSGTTAVTCTAARSAAYQLPEVSVQFVTAGRRFALKDVKTFNNYALLTVLNEPKFSLAYC